MNKIKIKIVDFDANFSDIEYIRSKVFISEQEVPVELEWDEYDKVSTHILAYYDNKPVATARLLMDGHIGRMAVLKEYRNRHIGKNMLKFLVNIARKKSINKIELSAQEHAVEFYKKFGFSVISDVYMDAGIPHYDMKYIG
ncbi:MAG: GNAT family N-acetyltransferase [Gammaproteobacteria bacterium]|nr:GNAT family N-acetyltransferase [Gammaproteobacteria bacterium]